MAAGDWPDPSYPLTGTTPGQAKGIDWGMFGSFTLTGITTERRLFAAMMEQGMLSNPETCSVTTADDEEWQRWAKMRAKVAYIHADALLAELDKPKEPSDVGAS